VNVNQALECGAKRRESFRPPFSKGGGVQGQSPWALTAVSEIPKRSAEKSFARLFKGGRVQRQRLWSLTAVSEISVLPRRAPKILSNKTQQSEFCKKHGAAL